jgi:hypothetical protein
MHPRERVLSLAQIISSRGEKLPLSLIDEAKRLNMSLERFVSPTEEKTKPTINSKGES